MQFIHDVKTPLMAIEFVCALAKSDAVQGSDNCLEQVDVLLRAVKDVSKLVSDLEASLESAS